MSAEDQIKRWAAAKLDIPADAVFSVEFVDYDGYWLSEVTFEPAYHAAHVLTTDREVKVIRLDPEDFGGLIREILNTPS